MGTESTGLRERKKARQHQQILETAVRLFRRRGFPATTVEQIVGELEISPATFYNYFPSKDAVLAEVGRVALERTRELLDAPSDDASAEARLRGFVRRVSQGVANDKELWRAIFATGALNRPAGFGAHKRTTSESNFVRLEKLLAEGQERGEFTHALPAAQLAQILQGVILKLLADYVFDFPEPHELAERADAALALFLCKESQT